MRKDYVSNEQNSPNYNSLICNVSTTPSLPFQNIISQVVLPSQGTRQDVNSYVGQFTNNSRLCGVQNSNQVAMNQVQNGQQRFLINESQIRFPPLFQQYQPISNVGHQNIFYQTQIPTPYTHIRNTVPIYAQQVLTLDRNECMLDNYASVNTGIVRPCNVFSNANQINYPQFHLYNENCEQNNPILRFTSPVNQFNSPLLNMISSQNLQNILSDINTNSRDLHSEQLENISFDKTSDERFLNVKISDISSMNHNDFLDLAQDILKKIIELLKRNPGISEIIKFFTSELFVSVFDRLSNSPEPVINNEEETKLGQTKDGDGKTIPENLTRKEKNSYAARQSRAKRKIRYNKRKELNEYLLKEHKLFFEYQIQMTSVLLYLQKLAQNHVTNTG